MLFDARCESVNRVTVVLSIAGKSFLKPKKFFNAMEMNQYKTIKICVLNFCQTLYAGYFIVSKYSTIIYLS